MSQAETLALVATAVDNASGPLKQVRKALDELARADLGPHQKQLEKFRKELSGLAGSTDGFRRSGVQVTEFGKRFQELSARAAATSVGISRTFIPALATLGISTVTVTSALTGLTLATQRYGEAARDVSKVARETGFNPRFVQGIRGAAEDLKVSNEQITGILEDLSGKFQRFSLPGGGELGKNMALNPAFRNTFAEMRRIMADLSKPLDERNEKSLGVLVDRINELKKTNPDIRVREMVKDIGLDPALVDLANKNWSSIQKMMDAFVKKVGEYDLAKAERWRQSNKDLADSFLGLQNAVGDALIDKLTGVTAAIAEFIDVNKVEITGGIKKELDGIATAANSVITLFNQVKSATEFLRAPQEKEGEGRWDFFKRRWGLDGGDQKRRPQLPAEPSTVPPEVLEQMNGAEALPEVKVTPPANPKYRAPFSPRSGQQLPKADAVRFADGDFSGNTIANRDWQHDLLADSPLSQNVEDRRGYVGESDDSKAVVANTEQLVVLNRLLDEWLHGKGGAGGAPGGGDSGGAYRFTGGGAVAGPGGPGGMGGLPDLPTGGTGVPGGNGMFDRLQSPLGRRRSGDGAFGRDEAEPPAPAGQRPSDRFLPGSSPFGPSETPNQFRPVGPGSRVEPAVGQREVNKALSDADRQGALFNPITSNKFMGGVGADSSSRGRGAHQGEDWGAPVGSPVHAVKDGTIERISTDNFGTPTATIRHDDGTYTRDMHLKPGSIMGKVGDRVTGGQQYASSGSANGVAHLHHERWQGSPYKGGKLISPSQEAGRSTKQGMVGGELAPNQVAGRGATNQVARPDVPSWPRTLPQAAGPQPGALGSQVENLPTRPTVPDNLPEGAMNPNATALLASPQGVGDVKTSRGSWYSQFKGKHSWVDREDRPGSNALRVPDSEQGIATPGRGGLGEYYRVTAPNGVTAIVRKTDVGPAARTGRTIDVSAAAAEKNFGYSPKNFPTDGKFTYQKVGAAPAAPTPLAAKPVPPPQLPEGVTSPSKLAGALPPKDEGDDEAEAGGFSKPGQFSKPGGFTPVPGALSAKAQQAQKFEHNVTGRASVDVSVKAPRGTQAKASGDGMFKQVSLNRTMAGEQAPATQHASGGEEE